MKHRRKSIRLKEWDYTEPGAYFVTICTHNREPLFGQVVDGKMVLNEYGQIVWEEWFRTAAVRPNVELFEDEFVVMPNHIHGIIWIVGDENVGAQRRCAPTPRGVTPNNVAPGSLGAIVRAFKSRSPNASTRCGVCRGAGCGNATTTNTSSATNAPSTPSAATSSTTPGAGTWTATTLTPPAPTPGPATCGACCKPTPTLTLNPPVGATKRPSHDPSRLARTCN